MAAANNIGRAANGTPPTSDQSERAQSTLDLIAEAEKLRIVLTDASARLSRLLAALKHQRRQSRAVQAAMQSLKQLQLDG